jgi:Ca2+-transporting ATPase
MIRLWKDETAPTSAATVAPYAEVKETHSAVVLSAHPGLTSETAATTLEAVGPNRLPDPPRRGVARRVTDQLRDPMILLLLAAATLTIYLHDWPNTVIILAVVVFNTTVGVVQEVRAEQAMAALRRLVAPTTHVVRDGVVIVLLSEDVVPGDLAVVSAGDVLPADGRLVEAHVLQVDESRVTGESLPVGKDPGSEVVGGTLVTHGNGRLEVTRTGANSGVGRIAALLASSTPRRTPLQHRLTRLSRSLVILVGVLTAVVVASGLAQGRPVSEMVVVGLSLAVAAVPESLPAVVTVALAMGAHRMAQRNAVVRSLPAVETLGSVTVVATDKTGTITEGTMLAQVLWVPDVRYDVSGRGYEPDGRITALDGTLAGSEPAVTRLLRDVALCNGAELRSSATGWSVIGDPLEGALLVAAQKGGVVPAVVAELWPRTGEEPFDHRSRTMTTHHRHADGRTLSVSKGAPEAFAGRLCDRDMELMLRVAEDLASSGYRVLAVADTAPGRWAVAGLVAIGDPPRTQAAEVVADLGRAGIRLVLLTGDHPGTAAAIARRVGIAAGDDTTAEGATVAHMSPDERRRLSVVARVRPEQKVDLVEAMQHEGEVVAMLGDGVNDAPALRRADIGVAAGLGGTEVAKEAADLVLMDDDLATVVAAVEEGRRIFANIRAFLTYAVAGGLAEVGVMLGGALVGLVLPLLPGQILWINLLTHGLVGVAFGAEPTDPQEMHRPPRPPSETIFTARSRLMLVVAAVALTVSALTVGAVAPGDVAGRRTAVFLTLGLGQLGVALALRSRAQERRGARGLERGVLTACLLMAVAAYAPGVQGLLQTASPTATTLAVIAFAAAVPGTLLRLLAMRSRR